MGELSLEDLVEMSTTAVASYVERGEPSPPMELVMHPTYFGDLRVAANRQRDGLGSFLQQRADGVFEFMHHPIRQDIVEDKPRLVIIKNEGIDGQ